MKSSSFGALFLRSLIFGFLVENLALLIFTADQIKDSNVITYVSISGIIALTLVQLRVFIVVALIDKFTKSYEQLKAKISAEPELDNNLHLLITTSYGRLLGLKDSYKDNAKQEYLKMAFCLLIVSIGFVHYSMDIGIHFNDLNLALLWEPRSLAILVSLGVWLYVWDSILSLREILRFRKDPCIAMKNLRRFDPDAAKKEALRIFGISVDQFATFYRSK